MALALKLRSSKERPLLQGGILIADPEVSVSEATGLYI